MAHNGNFRRKMENIVFIEGVAKLSAGTVCLNGVCNSECQIDIDNINKTMSITI